MTEVRIKIPDKKLKFFLELVWSLGFEVSEEADIPEEHKVIVWERIRTSKPDEMVVWKDVRKQLRFRKK